LDHVWGFTIQFDDRLIFKVAHLPEDFVFQSSDSNHYFVSRLPLNFFSRRRIVLSDSGRVEIASIEYRLFYTRLKVGNQCYLIRYKMISVLAAFFGRHYFEVKELGIRIDSKHRFFLSEVVTHDIGQDAIRLAIIVLLQFSELHRLREA
jgi:hypothetical protein